MEEKASNDKKVFKSDENMSRIGKEWLLLTVDHVVELGLGRAAVYHIHLDTDGNERVCACWFEEELPVYKERDNCPNLEAAVDAGYAMKCRLCRTEVPSSVLSASFLVA